LSVFSVKVSPKNDFQSITEEPKYEAKALTVVTDTVKKKLINSGGSCSGNYSSTRGETKKHCSLGKIPQIMSRHDKGRGKMSLQCPAF